MRKEAYVIPWERVTNEHHNGLLRLWLPKGTDIATVSDVQLQQIMEDLNNRPRKQLGWRTPAEKWRNSWPRAAPPAGGAAMTPIPPTP